MAKKEEQPQMEESQAEQPEPQSQVAEPPKPDLGYNKEYIEYKVDVTTHFVNVPGGGQAADKYTGERGKAVRTGIRIEPYRAEATNRNWHTRKLILLEVGDSTLVFEKKV